jgi:hypothetical protein
VECELAKIGQRQSGYGLVQEFEGGLAAGCPGNGEEGLSTPAWLMPGT